MESQFPGNSQKGSKPAKEVKPVVTGRVIQRKKSLARQFKETFTGDATMSTRDVAVDVLLNIVVPSLKDLIFDSVSEGVERKLFGEARSTARRGRRPAGQGLFGNVSYNAYNRYAQGSTLRPDPRQGGVPANRGRVPFSAYDEIVFSTRAEANDALDQMYAILSDYEVVSVSDVFEMAQLTGEFTDSNWGWTDLQGADVQKVTEGYVLNLPRPAPIAS